MNRSYVTVISTDDYLPGVLALAKNIRDTCRYPLLVITSNDLSKATYEKLKKHDIKFIQKEDINISTELLRATQNNAWFSHWANSFLKLRIFDLTDYDKIVFIDCDMMLLESVDEVFEAPDMSATIGGQSYPGNEHLVDLNSGFIVIIPREGLSEQIAALIPEVAEKKVVFGDQDVIQAYFTDWQKHSELLLPGGYNVWFSHYQFYLEHEFVKVVHFIGRKKPWMMNCRDLIKDYIKCLVRGNTKGIAILNKYRKILKEVSRI